MALSSSTAALEILLTARDEASPVLDKGSGSLGKFGSAAKTAFGIIGGAAGGAAVGMLSDAARAAAEDEANMVKLQIAVQNSGVAWEANSAAIEARIKKGQALAFTDDAVRDSIAQLTTATGDVNKAMEMQGLVMDIARGRNISLGAATDIAQKAALGQFGALKKIGIVLDEGSTATEALGELQKRYANQATGYGESTQAAMFKVKDSIDEWKESIGAATGPAMGLIALLPGLSAGFTGAGAAAGAAGTALHTMTGVTLAAAAPFFAVAGAAALVGVALWQVGETVKVVTDNWDIFVLALKRGDLNDIPIFGFFFEKAQQVLNFIDMVRGAWDGLTSMLANFRMPSFSLPSFQMPSFSIPGFAEGTPFVPQTGIALVHRGERIIPADQNRTGGAGGLTVNLNGPVYGMLDLEQKIKRIVREAYPQVAAA